MEKYNQQLKQSARTLRASMTDAEQKLWYYLRRKQIHGLQFYRQKPVLNFIVDFYCPAAKLVVELDGSQHAELEHQHKDQKRDSLLKELGLLVLLWTSISTFKPPQGNFPSKPLKKFI